MANVKLGPVSAPLIPLIVIGIGMYLTWFGVHYWDSTTKYPTDPLKSVLQGNGVPSPSGQTPASAVASAVASAQGVIGQTPSSSTATSGAPIVTTVVGATNRNIGMLVAAAYGWSPTQSSTDWNDLVSLWTQESSWNNQATNPSSGAYGIAQALGHGNGSATQGSVTNEYGGYGISNAMAQKANSGDATSQITWGLQYIKDTYGSPSAAWAHEQTAGWY